MNLNPLLLLLTVTRSCCAFVPPVRLPLHPVQHVILKASTKYYEDPSGLFQKDSSGGYIPAGLTSEEWTLLRQKEAEKHAKMNYAAWGPRFQPADGPVADDMAWMVTPSLWTGDYSEQEQEQEESGEPEDHDLPLPLTPHFLQNAQPWQPASCSPETGSASSWQNTYKQFCLEESSVQEMVVERVATADPEALILKTCELVAHILQGVTHYGNEHNVDLTRISHHCCPDKSDWEALQAAEEMLQLDVVAGEFNKQDLLKATLQVRFRAPQDQDILAQFSKADLAEMALCADWYTALKRVGISDPFHQPAIRDNAEMS